MDTTTEIGFYTLCGPGGSDPVTFCASCALVDTNAGFRILGFEPAESMAEAAAVLHLQVVLNGNDPDEVLTYHEHGSCELCEKES